LQASAAAACLRCSEHVFRRNAEKVGVAFLCTLDLMTTRRTRVFRRGFVAPGPVAAAEGVDATQLPRLQLGWHRLIPQEK
jgi:hypothetical protein